MSITLLRTFLAIAERGSFQEAADQVCVSPAAVSQQMRNLEQSFRVTLFDRSRRTPQLTRQGKALVPKAREVLREYDAMIASLQEDDQLSGELIIGAVSSTMSSLAPTSIRDIMSRHPGVHIRVVPDHSHELLIQVDRGAVDAAIMSEPSRIRRQFNWRPFARESMMLICARDEECRDPSELLRSRPYIRMTPRAWVSEISDDLLQEIGVTIRDSMELDSLENISKMVSHNLGVAIVPKPCVPDSISPSLAYIPLGNPPRHRNMGVLSRSDSPKFKLIDELCDALEATVARAGNPA